MEILEFMLRFHDAQNLATLAYQRKINEHMNQRAYFDLLSDYHKNRFFGGKPVDFGVDVPSSIGRIAKAMQLFDNFIVAVGVDRSEWEPLALACIFSASNFEAADSIDVDDVLDVLPNEHSRLRFHELRTQLFVESIRGANNWYTDVTAWDVVVIALFRDQNATEDQLKIMQAVVRRSSGFVGTEEDITERRILERQKNLLQEELYHRSKTNIQIISSLMNLQARHTGGKEAKEVLFRVTKRLESMTWVFDRLYDFETRSIAASGKSIEMLVHALGDEMYSLNPGVRVITEIAHIQLEARLCTPLGIIVHECITNSFRHAFPLQRAGTITVALYHDGANGKVLSITDDGIGINEDTKSSGLGLAIITLLSEQVTGELELKSEDGLTVEVRF